MIKQISGKVAASTLPEVLVAMVVLMVVFSAALAIITRVSATGVSVARQQVTLNMQSQMKEKLRNNDFSDKQVSFDGIEYHHEAFRSILYPNLFVIRIKASQEGIVIDSLKRLARYEDK